MKPCTSTEQISTRNSKRNRCIGSRPDLQPSQISAAHFDSHFPTRHSAPVTAVLIPVRSPVEPGTWLKLVIQLDRCAVLILVFARLSMSAGRTRAMNSWLRRAASLPVRTSITAQEQKQESDLGGVQVTLIPPILPPATGIDMNFVRESIRNHMQAIRGREWHA